MAALRASLSAPHHRIEGGDVVLDHAGQPVAKLLRLGQHRSLVVVVRKLIGFDPETQQALDLLSRDSGKSLQQLADEAFGDLLAKHNRPRTLKDALKQGAKRGPANENKPKSRPSS